MNRFREVFGLCGVVFSVVAMAACPVPASPEDGGSDDAGRAQDDAGFVDAGDAHDAGFVDAGDASDAGFVDGGDASDAGFVDGGPADDAGVLDAGLLGDGGAVDAGPMPDGGDAGDADAGDADAGNADAGDADAGDADAGGEDAGDVDAGPPTVAGPVEVIQGGTGGFLLRGVVLTPDGILDPGEVLVVGAVITCVAPICSDLPAAQTVTVIDTHGVISPGLIDGHNHLAYNFLSEWAPDPPQVFGNRYEWSDVQSYEDHVEPYAAHGSTGTHYCPAVKWGELRSIVHGTTTVQGQSAEQSCVNRLARNADHFHGLGHDHMQTSIGSPREITDAQAAQFVANFTAATNPTTRLAVHMCEGVAGNNVELEFASFSGRDTRPNRHMGVSLLQGPGASFSGTAVLIHSVALTFSDLEVVAATNSKIVWSPSSNIVLYGTTAPIELMLEMGITVGIGPDWTVSGEDDLLAEMRFARAWADAEGAAMITPKRLWEMATLGGADVVGLAPAIGRLAVGSRADISVFPLTDPDPYLSVIESRGQDVRLVIVDGQGFYGDLALEASSSVNAECDLYDACGNPKFLCVRNTPGAASRAGETLSDVETQLYNILEGIGYPPNEQYGRGDELQPLLSCP